mgnify:CR=1 FL=1
MGTISRITTFSTGDTLTASDLNGEFDNIISTANGSINADNLGVTAGQASASKAIVLDANKDFANVTTSNQIRNLTISGSLKIGTTFLPDAAGGADLGSTSLEWGDVYVADDKYLYMGSDQNIKIGYDETTTDSLAISAIEGAGLAITLRADEGDDAGDEWKLNVADGGVVTFGNDIASAGTFVTHLTLTPHATVASSTLALAGGLTVAGATQANSTVTVGVDDQGYDVKLFGDTASAYLMWDTSADKLLTAGGATIDIVKDKLLIGGVAVTTTAAELNLLDTASAGTVVASKAVVVDSNKDIASFRNVTLTGELDAATGDFSGDVDVDGTLEADAITLGGTALGSLYSPIAGSSSIVTVGTIGTGTWQGTAVALAYGGTGLVGATDGKIVIADGSGAPVLLDVGSSTAITVLGTVATGTWQGTAVASAYLDADTAHLSTTQTFSGAKTFSAAAQFSNTVTVGVDDTGYDVQFFGATSGSSLLWDESADDLILTNAGLAVGSDATGDVYYRDANGFLARLAIGSDGQVLTSTGTVPNWEAAGGGSGGDFSGPGSSTDNAVLKFDGTGGKTGQNSGIIIDDSNNITGAANVTLSGELDAATGDFSGDVNVAGEVQTASIGYTDGDNAMTIADGGGVTFPQAATFTSGFSNNDQDITNVGDIAVDTISGDADANTTIGFPGSDVMTFSTGGTEALRINDEGVLGIKTTPAGGWHTDHGVLQIGTGALWADPHAEASADNMLFLSNNLYRDSSDEWRYIVTDEASRYYQYGGEHYFDTAPSGSAGAAVSFTNRLKIDSSGNIIIKSSSTAAFNPDSTLGNLHIVNTATDTDNQFAGIAFQVGNGSGDGQARIDAIHDGTGSAADLAFSTRASDGSVYERMRLGSAGNVAIGTATDITGGDGALRAKMVQDGNYIAAFENAASSGGPLGIDIDFSGTAPDNNSAWFLRCQDSSAARMYVYSDGDVWTSDAGTLTSDERLKTNIVDASDKLADLMRLRVRNYEWTPEYHPNKVGEKKLGFIAQELETVFPSLISEHDIAPDNAIVEQLYGADDDTQYYVEGDDTQYYAESDVIPDGKQVGDVKTESQIPDGKSIGDVKTESQIPDGKEIGDIKIAGKAHEPTMRKAYKNAFAPILVKALQEVTVRLEAAEAKIAALESA